MPNSLKRYQTEGHLHFIPFNCYHRLRYLHNDQARIAFETALETLRQRHDLQIFG